MQARIFEPFTQIDSAMTRRHGGAGLGLSISQNLVEAMASRIQVASELGEGSSFSFELTLPLAPEVVAEPAQPPSAARLPHFGGKRVLIVEDHSHSQEILLEMTEALGCVADVASDGSEALDCVLDQPQYDLILMDMQMPRMNGLDATRSLRRLPAYHATPVIALTANAFDDDRQSCLEAGMSDHIGKPVTLSTLARVMAEWLPSPGHGARSGGTGEYRPRPDADTAGRSDEGHLRRFIDASRGDLARLRTYVDAGEVKAARTIAHDLKGIAGLLGAHEVAEIADELGQALRAGLDNAVMHYLADKCEARITKLDAALAAEVS